MILIFLPNIRRDNQGHRAEEMLIQLKQKSHVKRLFSFSASYCHGIAFESEF